MDTQQLEALAVANDKRNAKARLRVDLRAGRVTVADVLEDRPACVHGMMVIDVLRLARGGTAWQAQMGRRAMRDGINLLVRVEQASDRTLKWAAVNAPAPCVRKASAGSVLSMEGDSRARSADANLEAVAA